MTIEYFYWGLGEGDKRKRPGRDTGLSLRSKSRIVKYSVINSSFTLDLLSKLSDYNKNTLYNARNRKN